jgi:hypothetical protein
MESLEAEGAEHYGASSAVQASKEIGKKVWLPPQIITLPRLSDLTLQSGSIQVPCEGGSPGGGSTVCP